MSPPSFPAFFCVQCQFRVVLLARLGLTRLLLVSLYSSPTLYVSGDGANLSTGKRNKREERERERILWREGRERDVVASFWHKGRVAQLLERLLVPGFRKSLEKLDPYCGRKNGRVRYPVLYCTRGYYTH